MDNDGKAHPVFGVVLSYVLMIIAMTTVMYE